jgi:phosphatidylserine decarboxylase
MMAIHKEGYKIILTVLALLIFVIVVIEVLFPQQTLVHYILYAAALLFFISVVRFFRDPVREVVPDDQLIISPADGIVVCIKELEENEYFKDKRLKVSVFMSIFNVHVNWYPVSGKVKYLKYYPGKYLFAWNPKSSLNNERNTFVLENKLGKEIMVCQIAGGIARRIVYYTRLDKEVTQGEEIGIIKFGSRVDLFLPLDTKLCVNTRQRVRGGQSIIGRFN